MRATLARVAVLLHVALLVVYLSWARGGSRPELYLPLALLVPGLVEMVLLFPPLRRQETADQARARARRQLLRDPLLHVGLLLLLFVLLQVFNGPRPLLYDAVAGTWFFSPPPLPGLPSCLHRAEAAQALAWFGTALAGALAVRHGLSRRAKETMLELLGACCAALALFGLVQYASGTTRMFWTIPMPARFFATFAHPGQAGLFFTLAFLVSGGALVQALAEEAPRQRAAWLGACALLNLLAASFSLSPLVVALCWGAALIGAVHASLYLGARLAGSRRLRLVTVLLILAGLLSFLHFVAYPENRLHRVTTELAFWREQPPPAYPHERAILRRVASQIWRSAPVHGVGTWGYHRAAGLHLTAQDWNELRPGEPATPFSDPLQFLCEMGVFGCSLALASVALLIVPVVRRLYPLLVHPRHAVGDSESSARLHYLPPRAAGVLGGLLAVAAASPFDIPFRNPLILLFCALVLAALPALLPRAPQAAGTGALPVGRQRGPEAPPRHRPSHRSAHGPRAARKIEPGAFQP